MVAEASSRRKGVAHEALNMFMAYTVKYLVSTLPIHLLHDLSLAYALLCSWLQTLCSHHGLHCSPVFGSEHILAGLIASRICCNLVMVLLVVCASKYHSHVCWHFRL